MSVSDSMLDTLEHINKVRGYVGQVVEAFEQRGLLHDASKLQPPEKEMFDRFTPMLRGITYGSQEYKLALLEMGPALKHHYEHNRHHPERFKDGIHGMTLIDVLEMLADWAAACQRHADGNLLRSVKQNQVRFGYSDDFKALLVNTAREMGWLEEAP